LPKSALLEFMEREHSPTVAMVFAGGLGLASYHAGIYEAFSRRGVDLRWVTGSSAGAVTAALIAGNQPERRIDRLRAFWNFPPTGQFEPSSFRHLFGWIGAIGTRLSGSIGHFHPRLPSPGPFRSLYDLRPMRDRLVQIVDFDRLNGGEMRVCVAATDLETGDPVIFDSAHVKLEIDHLLASCGFLPEFPAVSVGGRQLGDGGFSVNAPFDPVLESDCQGPLLVYIADLYARDGESPQSLEAAAERKSDLLFGNQTFLRLKYLGEARKLRRQLRGMEASDDRFILLSYRPGAEEAGPEKSFDFSEVALAQRWRAGSLDFDYADQAVHDREILAVRRPKEISLRS
jgi:NTE family protein